ncbi:MAG: hypothetical protein IH851_03310 [Armatimonadetes bacterium]|nr:hypothetical protein [Armatimonadota bacterium]
MTEERLFALLGKRLEADPKRSLKPVRLPPYDPEGGPYHKVQYVIELVGTQLIPGDAARRLLKSRHKSSLGDPEIYVMVPGQRRWKALWTGEDAITYDSLALAWDLVSSRGALSEGPAKELWKRAERVAKSWKRRAMPLPPPEDAAKAAQNLKAVQESLDVGVHVLLRTRSGAIPTQAAIEAAYSLGFRMRANDLLEWWQSGWSEPILWIHSMDEDGTFRPSQRSSIPGLAVGYSVPCSPSPEEVMERTFLAADGLAGQLGASVFDDEALPLSPKRRTEMRSNLQGALDTFDRIGLTPGSPEALRLFEP